MEGCVPDSSKYVPSRGVVHVKLPELPAATSVANDCTRGPCGGGVFAPSPGSLLEAGHVRFCTSCVGLAVVVALFPSPPPNCPTMVSDVGILVAPKIRLLVKLICRVCPVGTVMTTGDQPPTAAGFRLAQVAVEPPTAAPQV